MGRLLRAIRRYFTRGARIERQLFRIERKLSEIKEEQASILQRLDKPESAEPAVSAKQLLNEYLYGEGGNE